MTVIAVTGASGFIGRHFCRELADGPCRIVPIVRPGTTTMRGASIVDFDEPSQASDALRGAHAVLHLAARANVLDEAFPIGAQGVGLVDAVDPQMFSFQVTYKH